jgi:hypothetical protein
MKLLSADRLFLSSINDSRSTKRQRFGTCFFYHGVCQIDAYESNSISIQRSGSHRPDRNLQGG